MEEKIKKQKRNPLPIRLQMAIITATSFFIAFSVIKYIRRGQFDLIETLIGALIFFVVFYLLSQVFYKRRLKKQEKEMADKDKEVEVKQK